MSRNKELLFTKAHDSLVKSKYKNRVYNYFEKDEWFNKLPDELKKAIYNVNDSNLDDRLYEKYLQDLEVEIKYYISHKVNDVYNHEIAEYLLACEDYYENRYCTHFSGEE